MPNPEGEKVLRRKPEEFHDGVQDGLEPLVPLDLNQIHDFDDLLAAYSRTSFGGRTLGEPPRSSTP